MFLSFSGKFQMAVECHENFIWSMCTNPVMSENVCFVKRKAIARSCHVAEYLFLGQMLLQL